MTRVPYASVSFSEAGPAKSVADLAAIQRHNNREEKLDHVVVGAPPPEHLVGTGDLPVDVMALLFLGGVDPDRRRSNGVLAYESVFGADHDYLCAGAPEEQAARLEMWVAATLAFILTYWGAHRVASVVLHVDEYTPHIHAVIVPLHSDNPEAEAPTWRLVGRAISGPGKWAQLHTDYAAAVAHLGLQRGKFGSERKRKPYGVLLEDLKQRESAAADAIAEAKNIQRNAAERELERVQNEDRLRLWQNVLLTQEATIKQRQGDLEQRERLVADALDRAVAENAAAARAHGDAARDRAVAGKLRDLIMSAQEAATEVFAALSAHERAAPSATLSAVIEKRRALRAAVRAIADGIDADETLRVQRDLAWRNRQSGRS